MDGLNFESRIATLEREVASLRQELEEARMDARVRRGLDQVDRGQVRPAREALEDIRRKYKIPAP